MWPEKRSEGDYCAGSCPVERIEAHIQSLPVMVNGKVLRVLLDTGSSTTLMTLEVVEEWSGVSSVRVVDGTEV